MIYEIRSKSDFQTGAMLVVCVPESEIDVKAFQTILASPPDFLLPFRHRSIDGQIELTYQIGKNSKLAYMSGKYPPKEYAEFLAGALVPLLEYDDWFLAPYSFVLNVDHLYYDKNAKSVKYIYIPSMIPVSEMKDLTDMVDALAECFTVTDASLEIKVLRATKKDFNAPEFIQMLKPYLAIDNRAENYQPGADLPQYAEIGSDPSPARTAAPAPAAGKTPIFQKSASAQQPAQPQSPSAPPQPPTPPAQPAQPARKQPEQQQQAPQRQGQFSGAQQPPQYQAPGAPVRNDDIYIDLPESGKAPKAAADGRDKKQKPIKEQKQAKPKGGMFGGKKKDQAEGIIMGAAAVGQRSPSPGYQPNAQYAQSPLNAAPGAPAQGAQGYQPLPAQPYSQSQPASQARPAQSQGAYLPPDATDGGLTQIDADYPDTPGFRLTSNLNLPKKIDVGIATGKVLSIGRFDIHAGIKQSDFEFPEETKEVSRRHAVVERSAAGYFIVDLGSKAGTFVNNQKIIPNAPHLLNSGDRISFGKAGADYIWEA